MTASVRLYPEILRPALSLKQSFLSFSIQLLPCFRGVWRPFKEIFHPSEIHMKSVIFLKSPTRNFPKNYLKIFIIRRHPLAALCPGYCHFIFPQRLHLLNQQCLSPLELTRQLSSYLCPNIKHSNLLIISQFHSYSIDTISPCWRCISLVFRTMGIFRA